MGHKDTGRALVIAVQPRQVVELFNTTIGDVVSHVFLTLMAQTVKASGTGLGESPDPMTAVVEFHNSWAGALALELGEVQASGFAEVLLGAGPGELTAPDVNDAVGEIANIIAGNIKLILPAGIEMGLPSVIGEAVTGPRMAGKRLLSRHGFYSDMGPFAVTLLEEK